MLRVTIVVALLAWAALLLYEFARLFKRRVVAEVPPQVERDGPIEPFDLCK